MRKSLFFPVLRSVTAFVILFGTASSLVAMQVDYAHSGAAENVYPLPVPAMPVSTLPVSTLPSPPSAGDAMTGMGGKVENFPTVVIDVRAEGNYQIPMSKINQIIKTRKDRPFEETKVEEDKRELLRTGYFIDVKPRIERTPQGYIVTYRFIERPILHYVKIVGNKKLTKKRLEEEAGIKAGDALDPIAVRQAKEKMETFYELEGFHGAHIEILRGDRIGDRGAVFLVNEGVKQRILSVDFVGNTIASDSRLKTQVDSKPGYFWYLIHGQFTRQLLEQDVEKLTTYYRKLGFFYAKVDYDIDETQGYTGLGEPNSWVNITFLVDEGPRCKIRDIRFIGNKLFSEGELKKELKSRIGKFYYQDMVEVDMGKVREEYGIRGHVFAEANPDPRIDGDEVELIIHVKEGPQCRVGEIKMEIVGIDGAEPYTALSTAMNRLSFKPGDLMNTREIENSERRLRFAGVFNSNPATGMLPNFTFEMPEQYLVDEERRRNEEKQQMIASPEKSNYRGQAPSNTLWYRKPVDVPGEPLRKNTGTSGTNPGPNPEESLEAFSNFFRIRTPQPVIPQSVTPQSVTPHSVRKPPVGMNTRPAPYSSGPLTGPLAGPHARSLYLGQQTYGAPTASPYNPYNSADGSAGSGLNAAPAPIAQPSQNQGIYGNPYGSIVSPIENPGNTPANLGVLPMSDPAAAPRPQNPIYPIRVHGIAQETRTGQLMMSVAVNSDSGLMGRFVIEEQNFDALRWPKNPSRMADWRNAFRGKGQIFRIEAVPGEQVQRYEVSWATPYLFNLDYSLRTSGYYYQRFYDEWYEDRVGGTISVGKNWTKDLSTSISYNGGNIRMYHPISPIPERLYSALGNNDFHTFGLTLTHDTRDNQYLATEGHLFTAGVSQTVGKHQYLAGTYDIRQYFMLRERPDRSGRWVLALRSAAGVTEGNTPIYDRYYAGGFSSIRGYEYRSVTPRDPYALNTGIGGTFEFYNSAELVFPLTADDMIRGLVFVDSGTVQEDIRDWQDDYRVSTGFGFRITIPMMGPAPIALDFAFPLVKSEFDKTQLFTFNVGFFR